MEQNMKNIYDTKEYQNSFAKNDMLFNLSPTKEETSALGENKEYVVNVKVYRNTVVERGHRLDLSGKKVIIKDQTDNVVIAYTINDGHMFLKLFHHQNRHDYLVFNIDLYGYSVMDLADNAVRHYIPKESFDGGETFIWCNLHYNQENNVLAVDGCYWACPTSVILLDFSDPMKQSVWADVNDYVTGYGKYDDTEFAKWSGTNLVLKLSDQNGKIETSTLAQDEYMKWL